MSFVSVSEKGLLREIRQGNEDALDVFIERYHAKLSRYLQLQCDNSETSQEILSETFARFFRMEQMTEGHTLVHLLSLADTVLNAVQQELLAETSLTLEAAKEKAEVKDEDALLETLRRLPIEYQRGFILRDILGLSCKDAAAVMSLDVLDFQSLLRRSRRMLKRGFIRRVGQSEDAAPLNAVEIASETDTLRQ